MSELEKIAISKAREAVYLDRRGSRPEAINRYREAIQILWRLSALTDNPAVRDVYREKIKQYTERLAELGGEAPPHRREEPQSSRSALVVEKPRVTWGDVVGLDEAKQALRESIVYPKLRPDLFPLGWPTGILLYGPPGCGKTLLVAAASNEIGATLYSLDAAQVMSKWLGESEKNIAELFSRARGEASKESPVIIFIDEADSLAAYRQQEVGGEARARNQLLKEMDGLSLKGEHRYLYVIAATNKPWLLDEPFIRRFQKRIYVRHPDTETRRMIFEHYVRSLKLAQGVETWKLALETEGYSAADIYSICLDAHMATVREMFENNLDEPRPISQEDFIDAIRRRRPSIIRESLKRFEEWRLRYGAS